MRSRGRTVQGYGRIWLLALAVAISAGVQSLPGPAAGVTPATVIVPGLSIGPWTLDMTFANLIWTLGTRTVDLNGPGPQFRTNSGIAMSAWAAPSLVAFHGVADNAVYALGTGDAGYATREGIGVGAAEARVTGAYGREATVIQGPGSKFVIYDTKGVAFQMAFNTVSGAYGGVERVYVFRPGRAGAIWRTP